MSISCSICSELSLGHAGELERVLPGVINAILTVRKTYAIIPSVGALVKGHSLVVPLSHRTAFLAEVNESEFSELMAHFSTFLEADHSILAFEHGSVTEDNPATRCGTSHAHLHLLPLPQRLHASVLDAHPISSFKVGDLASRARYVNDYIAAFTWNSRHCQGWVVSSVGVPSQFMRQRVAAAVGLSSWNWKDDPRPAVVRATIDLGFRQNEALDPPAA